MAIQLKMLITTQDIFEFGEKGKVLGIFAHMDVVPAGSGWDTDPYTPTIKDGRLYARGA